MEKKRYTACASAEIEDPERSSPRRPRFLSGQSLADQPGRLECIRLGFGSKCVNKTRGIWRGKGLTLGLTRLVDREFPGHRRADRPECTAEEILESARDTWLSGASSTPATILATAQAAGYRAERVHGATGAHCEPSRASGIL